MEVGRRQCAANLKSRQSHLVVNSLLNGQPVQRSVAIYSQHCLCVMTVIDDGSCMLC